jgi:hypothetical protein
MFIGHISHRATWALTFTLVGWCGALDAQPNEKGHALTVPVEEPRIEQLSSKRYVVTCGSGHKETIVLKGAPESSAAGPKNPYVLSRARQLCWTGAHRAK